MRKASYFIFLTASLLSVGCGRVWNDPYPAAQRGQSILYSAFLERPKHLDPVQSYSENEVEFTAQIYEPPLQYHYLKRPYTLIPATATVVPKPRYFDAHGKALPENADVKRIAWSDYVIAIKPGIRFQPHPAFARLSSGGYAYHALSKDELQGYATLADFKLRDTRELTADDYVYGIKRLALPNLHSPILGLMSEYVTGLGAYAETLKPLNGKGWIDLRQYPLAGAERLDRYRFRIRVKGKYPQFLYWLAMPFFAPMPWEADKFYAQPGMVEKNLTLDWYPVGTGPYMLTENNPNARMVLEKNPNFHGETYPCEGEAADRAAGLLADCGKPLPFIDKVIFTREKEQIPYWNKFLQGYYDASGISSDAFDQAVQVAGSGEVGLSDDMKAQGIRLDTSVSTTTDYMAFNMLDPLVGGTMSPTLAPNGAALPPEGARAALGRPGGGAANPHDAERARKLRQAISLAIDEEEFISIFFNGRGIAAQSPLPPGIFGYHEGREGINPFIYDWADGKPQRKPIEAARQLLAEAGYPHGRDAKTGEPLVINLDTTLAGVGAKSRIDWLVKQFKKIDVQLVIRSTDYNRFQEKLIKGSAQIFFFGWNADYPDPENFFFLLYGPQGKVKTQGENAANYANPVYDRLFERMRSMENGPERQRVIDEMVGILRHDAPWIFGFHPLDYTLTHAWLSNRKPSKVGNNTLKYQRIDPALREAMREAWNRPQYWPILPVLGLLGAGVWLLRKYWRARERRRLDT